MTALQHWICRRGPGHGGFAIYPIAGHVKRWVMRLLPWGTPIEQSTATTDVTCSLGLG